MERPLGLITIWKSNPTDPKLELVNNALFGYYQNAEDYLREFARVHEWQTAESYGTNTIAFQTGQYKVELSLVQAKGIDLSQETYLFPETTNAEQKND